MLRVGITCAAFCFAARAIDWTQVRHTLSGARVPLLLSAVALNAGLMLVKSIRLRVLLERRPTLMTCFLTNLSTATLNNLTPFRGGEVARLWLVERCASIKKSAAAVVSILEHLFEIGALSAVALVASRFVVGERWATTGASIMLLASATALVLLRFVGARPRRPAPSTVADRASRYWQRLADFAKGAHVLRARHTIGPALALSFASCAVETAMLAVTGRALGLQVGFPLAVIVLFGINMAIAIPSLPANAGTFEAGATFVLVMAGHSRERAIAFAFVYHLAHVLPTTLAGTIYLLRNGVRFVSLRSPALDDSRPVEVAFAPSTPGEAS